MKYAPQLEEVEEVDFDKAFVITASLYYLQTLFTLLDEVFSHEEILDPKIFGDLIIYLDDEIKKVSPAPSPYEGLKILKRLKNLSLLREDWLSYLRDKMQILINSTRVTAKKQGNLFWDFITILEHHVSCEANTPKEKKLFQKKLAFEQKVKAYLDLYKTDEQIKSYFDLRFNFERSLFWQINDPHEKFPFKLTRSKKSPELTLQGVFKVLLEHEGEWYNDSSLLQKIAQNATGSATTEQIDTFEQLFDALRKNVLHKKFSVSKNKNYSNWLEFDLIKGIRLQKSIP